MTRPATSSSLMSALRARRWTRWGRRCCASWATSASAWSRRRRSAASCKGAALLDTRRFIMRRRMKAGSGLLATIRHACSLLSHMLLKLHLRKDWHARHELPDST